MLKFTVDYTTGASLIAKIYYNLNGINTLRADNVALVEQPAGSGFYTNTLPVVGLSIGDDIAVYDTVLDQKIGSGEFCPCDSEVVDSYTIDLALEHDSGNVARCDIILATNIIQSHVLTDTGDDLYLGVSDALEANLYTVKYYINDALVKEYDQLVEGGQVLASDDTTYVSIAEADKYFNTKFRSGDWSDMEASDKLKCLMEATSIIDDLTYINTKVDESQALEFPRTTIGTPDKILKACCEIAMKLINGIDPDENLDELSVSSVRVDGAAVARNERVSDHILAGVPSVLAWRYLVPYLKPSGGLNMERSLE